MKEVVATITRKGQITIPVEVRQHLGVGTPDKVAFILGEGGTVTLIPAPLTLRALRGIVPPLPGRETTDFDDQIEEAMEEEAARVVTGAGGR